MHQRNSLAEIRRVADVVSTHPILSLGLAHAIVMLLFFVISFWLALSLDSWWSRLLWSIATGWAISGLILVGHDAAHQSLTPYRSLNNAIGRLCLGLAAHPLAGWQVEHNRMHHRWTNLRGKDCVLVPPSPKDWASWSPLKRNAFSITYRWWGLGLHYLARVWWPCAMYLKPALRAEVPSLQQYRFDVIFVLVVFAIQFAVVAQFVLEQGQWSTTEFLLGSLYAVGIPFLIWSWLIGYVALMQHTHPTIRWFDNEAEWDYVQAQLNQSPHMTMPVAMDFLSMHIMDHTAHHCLPGVPSYHLASVQQALEAGFPAEVKVQASSLSHLLSVLSVCQLYDYEQHCWRRFDGELATVEQLPGPPSFVAVEQL